VRVAAIIAFLTLVGVGTVEAFLSNEQLAELPGRGRPALSGGGTALTLAGVAISIAVYVALGVLLARSDTPEGSAVPIGMAVGAGAGLTGGTIRAYLVRDYIGDILARYGLGDLLFLTLAVFVALSAVASLAAGAALTWLSFRAARRPRTPQPPS
jgi:hypothetical protein